MKQSNISDYIATVWELWRSQVIQKKEVETALRLRGYQLDILNLSGLIAINNGTKHTYKAYSDVEEV